MAPFLIASASLSCARASFCAACSKSPSSTSSANIQSSSAAGSRSVPASRSRIILDRISASCASRNRVSGACDIARNSCDTRLRLSGDHSKSRRCSTKALARGSKKLRAGKANSNAADCPNCPRMSSTSRRSETGKCAQTCLDRSSVKTSVNSARSPEMVNGRVNSISGCGAGSAASP